MGQDILKDSLFIREFRPGDFRAAYDNYHATEDENGILFFANGNGVLEYDGSTWELHKLPSFGIVVQVVASPDGRIYVGGDNDFGYMTRDANGQLHYTSLRNLVDEEINLGDIWQIILHQGNVYFQSYQALIQFDGETTELLPIEHSWFLPIGEEMYIHTWDKGIAKLSKDSLVYVNTDLIFDTKGVEENTFRTLKGFGSEKLLFSEFNGIFLIDTITFESRQWEIPAHDELVKDGLYDAMEWNDSLYLISTIKNGLKWINRKGEVVRSLTDFNASIYGAAYRDTKGNVWLPADGIHHIIWPESQQLGDFYTLIRSVTVGDSTYSINSNQGTFNCDTPATLRSATFNFSSPGFDKADLQYQYKLEGFDQTWSSWTDNINKSYTNLDGGHYIFHVRARIVDGKMSKASYLKFNVPTLWYRTGWSYGGGGLLIWLLIVGAFKYRTNRLQDYNRKLENTIQDRTKEIRERNEELRNKNTELDNFVHRVSHDLIAPLRSIKGLIGITRGEKSDEGRNECYDLIDSSIDKQESFIKSILEHSVNFNQNIDNKEIILEEIFNEIKAELTYFERTQSVEFNQDFDQDFTINSDPDRVKIVLSNLINNAVKYHNYDIANPKITLAAKKGANKITIEVIDNGLGIEEEKLPHIFDMFYRASADAEGTGLGLYIVNDAMKKMNGSISVKSEVGKGTTFTMVFNT